MPIVLPNGISNNQNQFVYRNYKDYLKEKSLINILIEKKSGGTRDSNLNIVKSYSNYINYNNFLGCSKLKSYKNNNTTT